MGRKAARSPISRAPFAETTLSPIVRKAVLVDLFAALAPEDRDYFRASRERRFGMPLEQVAIAPAAALDEMRSALAPLRALLAEQRFVNGEEAAFADFCVFGVFMWARNVSAVALVEVDDPVWAWRERMLDLHAGLARGSAQARAA